MRGQATGRGSDDLQVIRSEPVELVVLVGLPPVYRSGLMAGVLGVGMDCRALPGPAALSELDEESAPVVVVIDADQVAAALLGAGPGPAARAVVGVVGEGSVQAYADALHAGAAGVVSLDMELEEIVAAVRGASRGQTLLPTAVARALSRTAGSDPPAQVSAAERGWLTRLAQGHTVAALARSVGYSEREMYRLLSRLYERLGATTRTEALLAAGRYRLLDPDAR